ncbi:MAG: hypothetical protein OXI13_03625 [Gammaproteobacteria bacterium]|nr:hypothetical protein [Gammaproteobacteria bacterium]MYA65688.1 hypothetical protein [Gammaproteobacteria bacterium]MYH47555.1 hypothetical protein [Gammaproteobacteria bacterium]MYL12262.1 hypothetical protein [Gammaproteobacteria bacterium]
MIRELTKGEIEQVDGGFGFPGAALGAVGSGVASWRAGDSAGQIAVNAGWGLVSGFTGGYAVAGGVMAGMRVLSAGVSVWGAYMQGESNRRWRDYS